MIEILSLSILFEKNRRSALTSKKIPIKNECDKNKRCFVKTRDIRIVFFSRISIQGSISDSYKKMSVRHCTVCTSNMNLPLPWIARSYVFIPTRSAPN